MNKSPFTIYKMFHVFLLLTLVILSACGRRGDPVPVIMFEEKAIEINAEENSKVIEELKQPVKDDVKTDVKKEPEKIIKPVTYGQPSGLTAVFTGKSIVLTWDETIGHNVRGYNIYRSSGNKFKLIGDSVIPAFSDRNIKPDTTYYYKVTVVGTSESVQSKEIEIVTEIH